MALFATGDRISGAGLARQRGIGVVGFIIGLVVGLAVALAVAVYVTKVPTPFTDKSGMRTAEQQAAEEAKLKNWDPNAALGGKRQAGMTAGGVVDAGQDPAQAPATPPSAPPPIVNNLGLPPVKGKADKPVVTAPTAAPEVLGDRDQELAKARQEAEAKLKADLKAQEEARAKARAEAKTRADAERLAADKANASADPIGTLLQARQNEAAARHGAAAATGGGDGFVYFVQAGAFRNEAEADSQKARLSGMGLNARITERDQAGRAIYRVRLGPFSSKAEADSAKARLENNGMDAALVRVQK